MPSILNNLDTRFPTFTGIESTERKVNTIQDYLYQLTEELRYALHNIDTTNMNEQELDGFVQTVTKPVYARIEDDEENISELAITAQGLSTRVGNAENSITSLNVTAQGLSTSVGNLETGMSTTLHMTASGVYITDAQGNNISINGGQLTAGTVVADSVKSSWVYAGNISASQITAGTIAAASITGLKGKLALLNENNTVSGYFGAYSFGNQTYVAMQKSDTFYVGLTDYGGHDDIVCMADNMGIYADLYIYHGGLSLSSGYGYGTLAQRKALTPTAGRLFFVRQ